MVEIYSVLGDGICKKYQFAIERARKVSLGHVSLSMACIIQRFGSAMAKSCGITRGGVSLYSRIYHTMPIYDNIIVLFSPRNCHP